MSKMHNPPHPGETLRPTLVLPISDAAVQLGVTRAALSRVLNERAVISPEMALRIEQWLGVENGGRADVWLTDQASYDLWQARKNFNPMDVFFLLSMQGKNLTPEDVYFSWLIHQAEYANETEFLDVLKREIMNRFNSGKPLPKSALNWLADVFRAEQLNSHYAKRKFCWKCVPDRVKKY